MKHHLIWSHHVGPLHASVVPDQVFELLKYEFNPKRRDRCVRVDPPVRGASANPLTVTGLLELEQCLREAVPAVYEVGSGPHAPPGHQRHGMAVRIHGHALWSA